jgi:Bacterial protein of unknown function (DUF916)
VKRQLTTDWHGPDILLPLSQVMNRGTSVKRLLQMVVLLVSIATSGVLAPLGASAAPATATNGYRVSPVRTDLTIKPGSNTTVTVFIQNASSAVENIQTVINDFQPPTDESGNPALLLNGASAPSHSIKQFVTIPKPSFTLQPNQQAAVNLTLTVPAGTAAGGYYGAVRFAPLGANGDKNINLSASVASLVLITVPGNLSEQLSIAGFGVTQGNDTAPKSLFFNNKNLHAIVRFQNGGNVQEQPFGKINLKQGSKTLATYAVNDATVPGNVLPNSVRRFTVTLSHVSWYGKYKVQGNFGYGSKGQLLTAQATFWVIPVVFIVIAVLIVLLILFLIFGLPRLIRRYNRRVIARANRNQRRY